MTAKTDKLSILFWLRMQSEKEVKIPFVERIDLELVDYFPSFNEATIPDSAPIANS